MKPKPKEVINLGVPDIPVQPGELQVIQQTESQFTKDEVNLIMSFGTHQYDIEDCYMLLDWWLKPNGLERFQKLWDDKGSEFWFMYKLGQKRAMLMIDNANFAHAKDGDIAAQREIVKNVERRKNGNHK